MSRTTMEIRPVALPELRFAVQDGFSRSLAGGFDTLMVVMVRDLIFGAFARGEALRQSEGLPAVVGSCHFAAQVLCAGLLAAEICCIVWARTMIGPINARVVIAIFPHWWWPCPVPFRAKGSVSWGGAQWYRGASAGRRSFSPGPRCVSLAGTSAPGPDGHARA